MSFLSALYLLTISVVYILQRDLIYHPSRLRVAPLALGLEGVAEHELATPDGERLVAWYAAPRSGRPTLFYLHGNAGALAHRAGRIRLYQGQGYGVFLFAYRGFAGSTGSPSEAHIMSDALMAYDHLVRFGPKQDSIVVYGESLGTAVAVQVAARRNPFALVLESPFSSAVDVGEYAYPFLPVYWLLKDRFEAIRQIGAVRAPLLVLHGEQDSIIPIRLGRKLFAAAHPPKAAYFAPLATHYTLYDHGALERVRSFLDSIPAIRRRAQHLQAAQDCAAGCAAARF